MRSPRIYQNLNLAPGAKLELDEDATRHLVSVLRIQKDDPLTLFNGDGFEYPASVIEVRRLKVFVKIESKISVNRESPIKIHLGQVISKGERMEFVIQKATELGVHKITPLISERCVVHLKGDRQNKKIEHWQKIVIAACEQCGRSFVPKVEAPIKLAEWVVSRQEDLKFILNLHPREELPKVPKTSIESIALLTGPEGGFTEEEVEFSLSRGFYSLQLGPRVLRTETAALAAITAMQIRFGDLLLSPL